MLSAKFVYSSEEDKTDKIFLETRFCFKVGVYLNVSGKTLFEPSEFFYYNVFNNMCLLLSTRWMHIWYREIHLVILHPLIQLIHSLTIPFWVLAWVHAYRLTSTVTFHIIFMKSLTIRLKLLHNSVTRVHLHFTALYPSAANWSDNKDELLY